MAPQVMSTFVAPIAPRAAFVVRSISSLSGQAGVVSSIVIDRAEPSMTTFLTMSRAIRSRPSSGSWTVRIASMTASWVRLGIGGRSLTSRNEPRVLTLDASISYRALAQSAARAFDADALSRWRIPSPTAASNATNLAAITSPAPQSRVAWP